MGDAGEGALACAEDFKSCADPALVPDAVEEVLRWTTPVTSFLRTAVVDTVLAGTAISAGARILAGADSWDVMTSARVYSGALTLEIARSQMLYKNLESRLAPDSKEPPRSKALLVGI